MYFLTIPFSHFCEKARWALDRAEIEYKEIQFAPVFQRMAAIPFGSLTVPVLIDAPHVVRESSDIIRYCDDRGADVDRLFPLVGPERKQVAELVERFDEIVAPDVRLWFYSWVTADPDRMILYGTSGLPPIQTRAARASHQVIAKALQTHFRLDAQTHATAAASVTREFEFVSELLADGREYLVGDRFTAADLSFASFVGAACARDQHTAGAYTHPPIPADLLEQIDEWRATPAGQWVARMYDRHRLTGVRAEALVAN